MLPDHRSAPSHSLPVRLATLAGLDACEPSRRSARLLTAARAARRLATIEARRESRDRLARSLRAYKRSRACERYRGALVLISAELP